MEINCEKCGTIATGLTRLLDAGLAPLRTITAPACSAVIAAKAAVTNKASAS